MAEDDVWRGLRAELEALGLRFSLEPGVRRVALFEVKVWASDSSEPAVQIVNARDMPAVQEIVAGAVAAGYGLRFEVRPHELEDGDVHG